MSIKRIQTSDAILDSIADINNNYTEIETMIGAKADSSSVPTKTSDLTNDSGFIDDTYHDSTKQDALVSGTNIKTINNTNILGSGNIEITGGGGEANVIEDVKVNGTSLPVTNKAVDVTVPTKTSDITNDSNFISSTVVTAFWSGTQAEYDAIATKDAHTLYLINES